MLQRPDHALLGVGGVRLGVGHEPRGLLARDLVPLGRGALDGVPSRGDLDVGLGDGPPRGLELRLGVGPGRARSSAAVCTRAVSSSTSRRVRSRSSVVSRTS